MKISKTIVLALLMVAAPIGAVLSAQVAGKEYLVPFLAHHVMGNIYFVGSKSLGIYLIATPQGHILVNAGLDDSVPGIQESVAKLRFKFSDIKILLISHAHFDHDTGAARIKGLTGAKYVVMDADVPVAESGGVEDFFYGQRNDMRYPPAHVDRVLHHGDTGTLVDAVLTAHLTPGHTRGCTTWTRQVQDGRKSYDVVMVGSTNVNEGYSVVNNAAYRQL